MRALPLRARSRLPVQLGGSPPSPLLLRAPMRFIAMAIVCCASGDSEPSDIAALMKRGRMASTGSTSIERNRVAELELHEVTQRERGARVHEIGVRAIVELRAGLDRVCSAFTTFGS